MKEIFSNLDTLHIILISTIVSVWMLGGLLFCDILQGQKRIILPFRKLSLMYFAWPIVVIIITINSWFSYDKKA